MRLPTTQFEWTMLAYLRALQATDHIYERWREAWKIAKGLTKAEWTLATYAASTRHEEATDGN